MMIFVREKFNKSTNISLSPLWERVRVRVGFHIHMVLFHGMVVYHLNKQ